MFGVCLLVLECAVFLAAELINVGPCDVDVETPSDLDLDKFATENGGRWTFVKIPSTRGLSGISNLELTLTPTAQKGEYRAAITTNEDQDKIKVLSDEIVENNGNGVFTATTKGGTQFKVYFLKYVPYKYAYYYVCSKDRDNSRVDYRYVVSHGALSDEDSAEIDKLENKFKFRGDLKDISIVLN